MSSSTPVPAPRIPLSEPQIDGNEWAYVKECLDTGWVSSVGSFVTRFEEAVAARVGARHAVAAVNGTAALHVALLVAGVGPGDEVLVPSLTFIAPANAIRYAGGWPVFVDVEPEHWQMDPAAVADFLNNRCRREGGRLLDKATGRRVAAVLPVDLLGHPAEMDAIVATARRHGLPVVEDATEALGARCGSRSAGHLADIACLSFNGNKILTTGGGGMIVTDDEGWAARARYLTTQAKDDPVEYVHGTIGFNYRLTNVLAAIGCAQMERLDAFVERKREIAARYAEALARVPGLTLMREASWARSTFWLYTVLVDAAAYGCDRRALMTRLADRGIESRPLWQPIHCSPAHADAPRAECPVAERLQRDALSLPSSVGLTAADQRRVIDAIRRDRG
jgi:perosamine synthetase